VGSLCFLRRVLLFKLSGRLARNWRASVLPYSFWRSLRPKLWPRSGRLPTDTYPENRLRANIRSHVFSQEPAMAVSNISSISRSNALVHRDVWSLESRRESASRLQLMPSRPLQLRVAVIGNHLPRQCGIATFTTDLCDAMAAEYGAGGTTVVAINDRQSSYAYWLSIELG
jgi:hypothetical protein